MRGAAVSVSALVNMNLLPDLRFFSPLAARSLFRRAGFAAALLLAPAVRAQWNGYAGDPQHTAISSVASLPLNGIRWSTAVDENPPAGTIYIHYGSPVITAANTVVVPVREWCINTAAVDPATGSVLVNSEDGILYRWNLATNTFTESIALQATGTAEAYTPTLIGPDGTVYAINKATLFALGVPEPGSAVLLLGTGAMLALRRRRVARR